MSWETSLRVVGKAAAVLEHALQAMGSDSLDQQSEEPNWYARVFFGGVMFGGAMAFGGMKFYSQFLKRIPHGGHVTPDMFAKKRWIKGVVTSWVTQYY
jgi:hypothetical protein